MILITGASSGIGEACARRLATRGEGLILVARRKAELEALAQELRPHAPVETRVLDIRDRKAVEQWGATDAELLSRTRVLISNAGLARGIDPIQDGRLDDWDDMIDTNLKGLLYVTHAVLPYLRKNPGAHIVNLGSVAGQIVYPKGAIYCATKFAVRALNEALRLDLNGSGIRVTEIRPGMVETNFSEVRLGDAERAKAVYAGMTPLTAQDIAESIEWCLSRPAHVNVQELVLYPVDQASPTVVTRR